MSTPTKIDIVYRWVDGSDKKWQAEKDKWYKKITGKTPIYQGSATTERFRDNDELKYSLRSVAECVPWINHIYIITGFNQVPKWLNTKHPKITIVPHEEIMPADALPTFNSTAIEMCITNIKNLSEHFIQMGDDMFFNKPLTPHFFYDRMGRAKVKYNGWQRHAKNIDDWLAESDGWTRRLILAEIKIKELFGKNVFFARPSHGIDPYLKSAWLEYRNHPKMKALIDKQIYNKFRSESEFPCWMFCLYALVKNRAVFYHSRAAKFGRHKFINFIYNMIHFRRIRLSNVTCENVVDSQRAISIAPTFCINDGPNNTPEILQQNTDFLEKRFPNKSPFEK